MPLSNPSLWDAFQSHQYEVDDRSLNQALCRTHNIRSHTATDAIREYKRFLYLTAIAGRRTVPSRAVDAVWHEHMEEGEADYAKLLARAGRNITHTPGRPRGHGEDYRRTTALYAQEFDEPVPPDYWPETGNGVGLLLLGVIAVAAAALKIVMYGFAANAALVGTIGLGLLTLWLFKRIKSNGPARLREPQTGGRKRWNDGGTACGGSGYGADCGGGGCGGD